MRVWIFAAVAAVALAAAGCGRKQAENVMGPQETVEAFCRAVAGGEFDVAMDLCDMDTMEKYIGSYARAWEAAKEHDGGAAAIAADMVSEMEMDFEDIIKEGEKRHVFFRMSLDGGEKKKLAIVRKEEGAWKVETVIDRP